jgi:hypothetical protein
MMNWMDWDGAYSDQGIDPGWETAVHRTTWATINHEQIFLFFIFSTSTLNHLLKRANPAYGIFFFSLYFWHTHSNGVSDGFGYGVCFRGRLDGKSIGADEHETYSLDGPKGWF